MRWFSTSVASVLALVILVATASFAQGTARGQDKAAVTFNEIERGFNVGASAGPLIFFSSPNNGPLSWGQTARVEVGYDISTLITVSLFGMVTANRAGSDYLGSRSLTDPGSGDYSSISPGAMVRVNFVGIPDSQGLKRAWFYARAGVGFLTFFPSNLFAKSPTCQSCSQSDVLGLAGVGVEYFTHLRHFSVGVEADGAMAISYHSVGLAPMLSLRYAF